MALTSQQSTTHCNDCHGTHLPGEPHTTSRSRALSGGRHLAPKKAKVVPRPQRQEPPRESVAHEKVEPAAKPVAPPSAKDVGVSVMGVLQTVAAKGRSFAQGTVASCRVWGAEAKRGFRDLIDLESLKLGTQESRHVDKPGRVTRPPVSSETIARSPSPPAPSQSFPTHNRGSAVSGNRVELLEQGASREHLLEVSVLESLGFFDPAHEIVVTMDQMETSHATQASPRSAASVPEPHSHGRQLIPDVDLTGWKPHVIARSKLGQGRFSITMITVLSVSLLIMAVIATNLLRAPANEAVLEEDLLAQASTQLGLALQGLEPILANVTTDVAEATSTLMSIDTAARDMFDAAALLGDEPEQQVLRQSAASLAQRSLALETMIGDALNYRLVLNPLWNSPDLNGVTDPTTAAAAVATWQANLADMVESLPTSSELAVHVDQVREFVSGLDGWRISYLDALSLGDLTSAGAAVADLDGQLGLLAQSGEDTLSGLFDDASTERGRILADLPALSG